MEPQTPLAQELWGHDPSLPYNYNPGPDTFECDDAILATAVSTDSGFELHNTEGLNDMELAEAFLDLPAGKTDSLSICVSSGVEDHAGGQARGSGLGEA